MIKKSAGKEKVVNEDENYCLIYDSTGIVTYSV